MEASNLSSIRENKIYAITIAYCPAVLLARSLIEYKQNRFLNPARHVVVLGHYPVNRAKNNNDIRLICESFAVELLDPGSDLGSAQSQNWCLDRIGINNEDYFINMDPDSNCRHMLWDASMARVLDDDKDCALISCWAPMITRYTALGNKSFQSKSTNGIKYLVPNQPTPFNLSMWRYSFVKEIGGIPQMGLSWGETEGPFYAHCQQRGKYHAYLKDYVEDETGKFIQDKQHNEYKNAHMRSTPSEQFVGSFAEFLNWKYPEIAELDTVKDLTDHNHP